jgi:Uma2 family endonuclease
MVSTTSKIVTYEEWLKMPEAKTREVVVDGEIIRMPAPHFDHAEIIDELQNILKSQIDLKLYRVLTTIFDRVIRKDPLTCREPDLAVEGHIRSTPELVVEVLSPSNTRRDTIRKTEDYESIGVPELWILSAEARTFEVLQLQDGKLRRTQLLAEGQLRPLRFPAAVVDVASVWPE